MIDRTDDALRTSRFCDLYGGDDDHSDEPEGEETKEEGANDSKAAAESGAGSDATKGDQKANNFGALGFKPRLTEYLIDSVEEPLADTLFYVR